VQASPEELNLNRKIERCGEERHYYQRWLLEHSSHVLR